MISWDNEFQNLRKQFVARSHERMSNIDLLLQELAANPGNSQLLQTVMVHFHWLQGSGGTYGFPEITQWGAYGEEMCDYLMKLQAPVARDNLDKLVLALRNIEQLFAAQVPFQEAPGQEMQGMKSTSELLIPPGALMGASQDIRSTGSHPRPASETPYATSMPAAQVQAGAPGAPAASMAGPPGSSASGPPGSSSSTTSVFPASPSSSAPAAKSSSGVNTVFPASPGAQSGQQKPAPGNINQQSRSASTPIGSQSVIPSVAAPPMSSSAQEATQILGLNQAPVQSTIPQVPTGEFKKPLKLAHIPADRKFAIFVESNLANLAPVKAMLGDRGLMVEGYTSATEAKQALQERLPDVLVVGTPLIDNNGYELVEYLRAMEGGNKPISVVLGQQAAFLDKVQAVRVGADAFFEFPSELSNLIDKLHTLLDRELHDSYKILSVEDDLDQANFIKLTLQSAGYTVLHLNDPTQFEEKLLSFEPDLVMLDVLLGDLTGFELAKFVRQNDRFATLPIIFLTTQNKLHQHIRSAIAGGDEHLVKPVAPQLLIATIASRLERAQALKRLIDRDGLTRCLNYGSFMERAQKIASADGYRSGPAMMMIDIDNMAKINEKLGFAAGDRVISNIANMLLKGFRNTDLISRFGNDQFAIVLEHLNPQQLQSLSSQVLGAIGGTPQLIKGKSVAVTCSSGISVLEQGMSVQEWLAAAQDALKKAKEAGGNRAFVKPPSR